MNALENIENLAWCLAGKIRAVADDRGNMLSEIALLRERLTERDKEAVKAGQDMMAELEAIRAGALRFEQERARLETRLRMFNDRLTLLAGQANSAGLTDNEKNCGG